MIIKQKITLSMVIRSSYLICDQMIVKIYSKVTNIFISPQLTKNHIYLIRVLYKSNDKKYFMSDRKKYSHRTETRSVPLIWFSHHRILHRILLHLHFHRQNYLHYYFHQYAYGLHKHNSIHSHL